MEFGTIRQINIDTEMQASYLDYAMSVIVARALPDVRDGLKPVHRRILWAMYDLGLRPEQPYKKSARIVGEVLGKYHPHGDAAVYEAMVRMAQDFSLRYPLVDGQGNFGSVDGDNAAAMRYTEARLSPLAMEMLTDIEKDTVDWGDNFDGTLKEPLVLPAALPNLIVNGSSGIAVGMSTNIPPHNLGEVCDALCYIIDNYEKQEDITVEDLMRFIPGPDFPTGGVVFRYSQTGTGEEAEQEDVIAKAYAGGKGSLVMQAKAHVEEMSRSKNRIVITELPYQTNKSNLLERIAELVRDGRIEGITDLRDESDRTGMRVMIELTRTVDPHEVLRLLYKLTPLRQTFGVSLLALVDGEPRLLSLKRALLHFIEHRQAVIVRRAKHDLEKAKQRAHILEGLLKALDILDQVIALIRASRTADAARDGLVKQFGFTVLQAQAILDMQLRRLAALERRKLETEYKELVALIKELEALLKSPKKVLGVIRSDLENLKARYGDPRRTQIVDRAQGALTTLDLLPEEELWLTLGTDGQLTRYRSAAPSFALPPLQAAVKGNTKTDLYLFTARGQVGRVQAHQVPEGAGSNFANLTGLRRGAEIAALLALPRANGEPLSGYVVLATAQGKVKRVNLVDLAAALAGTSPQVIGLDEDDRLVWAGPSEGGGDVLLFTARGQAIRFAEEDVRAMGLPAGGIGGIRLAAGDRVVAAAAVSSGEVAAQQVALVYAGGYGKRVPLADFSRQGRNGKGIEAAKLSSKTGSVVRGMLLAPADQFVCVQADDTAKAFPYSALSQMGRATSGRALAGLSAGQPVVRVYVLAGVGEPEVAEPVKTRRRTPTEKTAGGNGAGGARAKEKSAASKANAAQRVRAGKAVANSETAAIAPSGAPATAETSKRSRSMTAAKPDAPASARPAAEAPRSRRRTAVNEAAEVQPSAPSSTATSRTPESPPVPRPPRKPAVAPAAPAPALPETATVEKPKAPRKRAAASAAGPSVAPQPITAETPKPPRTKSPPRGAEMPSARPAARRAKEVAVDGTQMSLLAPAEPAPPDNKPATTRTRRASAEPPPPPASQPEPPPPKGKPAQRRKG